MKLHLFAIRDTKAFTFTGVMAYPAVGVAVRDFSDMVSNPENQLGKHPEDYELYEVGTFEVETGTVEGCLPNLVGGGTTFKVVR